MTNHFQRIEFIGRLGRDPVMRFSPGASVPSLDFSVCIESLKYDRELEKEVKSLLWITVNISGVLVDICKNLSKGRLVYVSGELMYDKYGNPPRRSSDRYEVANFEVNAELVKFLDCVNKPEEEENQPELTEYPKGEE